MNISELLGKLEAGFYAVPEIQRYFVWRNSQIRDFVHSIYNWYPIGGIIIWKMSRSFLEKYRELMRPLAVGLPEGNMEYMVIDGQQRLTSLLLIKKGSIRIVRPSRVVERKVELFFNPKEGVGGRFELGRRDYVKHPDWFNVTDVLNAEYVSDVLEEKARVCGSDRITRDKVLERGLEKLRDRLRNYDVTLIEAKLDYQDDPLDLFEKISRIFVTVNSKGTRIRMPDLVLALVGARVRKDLWMPFRDRFNDILEELDGRGFKIGEAVLMRLYLAVATATTKFKDAEKELDKKTSTELKESLEKTRQAIVDASEFLWKEAWIPTSDYLQSHYLMVTIGYLLHKEIRSRDRIISESFKKELTKWLILASAEKRYTGRLETDLYEDVSTIANEKGVTGLLHNLRLKSLPSEVLEGSYDEYHLTLLLTLYNRLRTRDWDLDQRPTVKLIGELEKGELQIHHIFPKEILEKIGKDQLVDEAANITILSDRANRKIGAKSPSDYLKELHEKDPDLLRKHFVPTKEELWHVNNYEEFLKERRKLILDSANEFLSD